MSGEGDDRPQNTDPGPAEAEAAVQCTQGYYPGSPSMNSLDAIFGIIRSPETPLTVSMDAWRVQAYS